MIEASAGERLATVIARSDAHGPTRRGRRGFTLIEMLVATALLALMMVLLMGIVLQVSRHVQRLEGMKIRQQIARQVLETMSRDLQAAIFPLQTSGTDSFQFVLNPAALEPYENPQAAFWQATLDGDTSLGDVGEVGYFVKWSATGIHSEIRQLRVPCDKAAIYDTPGDWLNSDMLTQYAPGSDDVNSQKGLLAENVIGLWILLFNQQNVQITPPYDSRVDLANPSRRIASVEIDLAVIDPKILQRVTDISQITSHYSAANADQFVAELAPNIREGVQVFKTWVNLEAAPR